MNPVINERSKNPNEAQAIWNQVVEDLGLNVIKHDYKTNQITTRLCYISQNDQTVKGMGKGSNELEIDLSASYEALEYYLASYPLHPYSKIEGTLSEISTNHRVIPYRCDPEIFLKLAETVSLPWIIYSNMESQQSYAVPMASVDLSYRGTQAKNDFLDYGQAQLYAASTGLASGGSYEEAVIHAALEIIERDALSYFSIDCCILNKPVTLINHDTLPEDTRELIKKIEFDYQNEILIMNLPSRYGAEVYVANFRYPTFEVRPCGSGASLQSKHALERAVHELSQSYNLMDGDYLETTIDRENLNYNSLIENVLQADLEDLIVKENLIPFQDNSLEYSHHNLSDYLAKIIELIKIQGSHLLINKVYQHPNGLSCVRAIIPGAEEFYLIGHYLKLNPNTETQNYIYNQLGKKFSWNDFNLSGE